jgi:hypothetical protein
MKKQVWIRQELFDETKQRCTVLEVENAALKAEVASLRINQQPQLVIAARGVVAEWGRKDFDAVLFGQLVKNIASALQQQAVR